MSMQKLLSLINLNEKSQKVYLALLKLADAPASIVAKKTGMERTTTYHQLEHLIKLGLVSSYQHRNIKRFVAENPKKIKNILESKISLVDEYLPNLMKMTVDEKIVNLKLYEGEDGMKNIIEEELACCDKNVYSIGYWRDLMKVNGGKISFTKRRLEKKVFSKCLRPRDDFFSPGWVENQTKELREVRMLPAGIKLSGMIFIFDNNVTVITPEEEGIGFIITSDSFSKSAKAMFDLLWEVSKKTN